MIELNDLMKRTGVSRAALKYWRALGLVPTPYLEFLIRENKRVIKGSVAWYPDNVEYRVKEIQDLMSEGIYANEIIPEIDLEELT